MTTAGSVCAYWLSSLRSNSDVVVELELVRVGAQPDRVDLVGALVVDPGVDDVLSEDAKNYHTWSYRQWILAHFNDEQRLWASELPYVEELLEEDVRNNSAWHHRFFVVFSSGVRVGDEDREQVLKRELSYVFLIVLCDGSSC